MIKEFTGIAIILVFLTGLSSADENACAGCHMSVGATKGIVNDGKRANMH